MLLKIVFRFSSLLKIILMRSYTCSPEVTSLLMIFIDLCNLGSLEVFAFYLSDNNEWKG